MDILYLCNTFLWIIFAASQSVLADFYDDSCEDSNSSDFDTPCQKYIQMARCWTRKGPICSSSGVTYWTEYQLARAACARGRIYPKFSISYYGFCKPPVTIRPVVTTFITIPTTVPSTTKTTTETTTPIVTTTTTTTPTQRTPRQFGGNNGGRGDTPCNDNCPDGPADGSAAVCGSDGETYETECHLFVRQCQADRTLVTVSLGSCPQAQKQCPSLSMCPKEYLPVCGSGNITYPSLCHFQIAACEDKDPTRKVLHAGECPNTSAIECGTCPIVIEEVCGTDNVTYSSECALREISCRQQKLELRVAYQGTCENQACPDTCSGVVDPVCATNGKTYISLCALSVEVCKNQGTSISVAYRGKCAGDFCDVHCPDVYEPLCDNRGRTYQNACELWKGICNDPTLSEKLTQEGCNLAIP